MSEKPTAEPNLIVISFLAGIRSRGGELYLAGNKVSWPPSFSLTEGEMAVLKNHRQAIKDAIRAAPAVNEDGLTGAAGGAAVGAPAPKSNATGPDPNVAPANDAARIDGAVSHLEASGKSGLSAKADEDLKRTNPIAWRAIHCDDPAVIAEADAAATRVMFVTHGVPSRWL